MSVTAKPEKQATLSEQQTPRLQEMLIELFKKLDPPLATSTAAAALKQQLETGIRKKDLPGVMELIISLLFEMRGHVDQERAGIEEFLRPLSERLREIETYLEGAEALREEALQSGRAFDAALAQQVHGSIDAVQDSADLGQLKRIIDGRVEVIRQLAERYYHAEQERSTPDKAQTDAPTEQQVKLLTKRLQTLETETGELRERIVHERTQALHDALTGIHNRRAYRERMAQEYARSRRYHTSLILLVWDIDRFKSINDTYGHKAGDKVLITIAHLLRDRIRETDFLARYGGEEFVILMPETSPEAALVVAETLRTGIAEGNFQFRSKLVPITISCGGALLHADDTPETLFERADAALYEAKNLGRNRCIFKPAPE